MAKINLSNALNSIKNKMVKHSPEILTGLGIAGMITTTVLSVKATPKALQIMAEEQERRKFEGETEEYELLPAKDVVKLTWRCYIPAAVTGVASIACLIGASSVNTKRNAALAAAYALSDSTLREYKEGVFKSIGEKKEHTVCDKVSEEKVKSNPVITTEVFLTEKGNTLCYEPISGRYFKSDKDKIMRAQNDLNKDILSDAFNTGVSLNQLYYEIGLPKTSMGDNVGWNLDTGTIDIYMSAQIVEEDSQYEGTPCLVMNYKNPPTYGF